MEEAPVAKPAPDLDVSVIVPVLTVDAKVLDVFQALSAELERLGKSYDFIFVFDGHRGPAWKEGEALVAEHPGRVQAIAFQQSFGESACLASGLEHARGRVVVTSPQYVQVDPREIESLLTAIDEGADFVAPWRNPRVDPMLNRVQSASFNLLMRRIVGAPFHDLNCYFRAVRREVLEEFAIYGDQYRFLPVTAHRQGYRVVEVKVRHLQEWGGTGFFGVGVYVRRLLDVLGVVFLTHFTHKPLRFFGTLGALFATIGGAICGVLVVQKIFMGGSFYNRPVLTIGMLLFMLGVQVIGFGLVGEIIIYTNARSLRQYRIERIYERSGSSEDDTGGGA
jgi:glycosyltransferase involved in cell wall biosynthesis